MLSKLEAIEDAAFVGGLTVSVYPTQGLAVCANHNYMRISRFPRDGESPNYQVFATGWARPPRCAEVPYESLLSQAFAMADRAVRMDSNEIPKHYKYHSSSRWSMGAQAKYCYDDHGITIIR